MNWEAIAHAIVAAVLTAVLAAYSEAPIYGAMTKNNAALHEVIVDLSVQLKEAEDRCD